MHIYIYMLCMCVYHIECNFSILLIIEHLYGKFNKFSSSIYRSIPEVFTEH